MEIHRNSNPRFRTVHMSRQQHVARARNSRAVLWTDHLILSTDGFIPVCNEQWGPGNISVKTRIP